MNCTQTRDLIHPYVDGELDLSAAMDLERHLDRCPTCARTRQRLDTLRTSITAAVPYHKAPPALGLRIREAITATPNAPAKRDDAPFKIFRAIRRPLALAASLLLVASLAWTAARKFVPAAPDLSRELVAAHVRSLQADHLFDVPSTDQHTVKPWFNGKLDFAPDVRDFAAAGFTLVGGRLDYLNGRPVAALIYRHEKHVINCFVSPAADAADVAPSITNAQGYSILHFAHHGLDWNVISDVSPVSLENLARAVQSAH